MKYLCNVFNNNFVLAGVSDNPNMCDTQYDHFSFVVFGVSPAEFCDAIKTIQSNAQDNSLYYNYDVIELKGGNWTENIRITRQATSLAISRGNLRILFHGDYRVISGSIPTIRKAIEKYEKAELKKQEVLENT